MDRREMLGALAALFGGVLLPAPLREQLVVVQTQPKDAFVAVMHHYWQMQVLKPAPAGIVCMRDDDGYIPAAVGPTAVNVAMTPEEIGQLVDPRVETGLLDWKEIESRPMDPRFPIWGHEVGGVQ